MGKQQELFEGFPFPKTNTEEVLLTLILQKSVSIFDFSYMSGFRTRVSEIQSVHGILLDRQLESKKNKFGNTYTYAIHTLPECQKEKAIEVYYKINAN